MAAIRSTDLPCLLPGGIFEITESRPRRISIQLIHKSIYDLKIDGNM